MTDELLELADQEIRELRQQNADLQAALIAMEEDQLRLYQKYTALLPPPTAKPLHGMRIGIIGHESRAKDYREMVERLGGTLLYASAHEKPGEVVRVVQKAQGTIFITAWGSHRNWESAEMAAIRYNKPLLMAATPGLVRIEEMILVDLLGEIEKRREDNPLAAVK